MKIELLIILGSLFSLTTHAQTIEKFSIDSGGASTNASGIEILYTIGEVAVQETTVGSVTISEGFIGQEPQILVEPYVFLQGPMLNPSTPNLMNDDLRNNGLIPTTSPYADNATCDSSVFNITGSNAIVDWVWVTLRLPNDNTKLINGRSALLQRNGKIVDSDGVSTLKLRAYQNTYYLAIQHRNHLGVMNASPLQFNASTLNSYDYTLSSFNTFGSNAQVMLSSGSMALWSGDANNSKSIIFSGGSNDANAIKDYILNDPANVLNFITFSSIGYLNQDLDLNGVARFSGSPNDSNIVKDNVLNHPSNVLGFPTYVINKTVPTISN